MELILKEPARSFVLAHVVARQTFVHFFLPFTKTPTTESFIISAASFIITEVQPQIETMACFQWEWQRSVITSIHRVPY